MGSVQLVGNHRNTRHSGAMPGYDDHNTILGMCTSHLLLKLHSYKLSFTNRQGLQSTHGLTELISYIIRLCINCLALLCVIPTALRWRREQQVLKQLQGLASRLQLQTPVPNTPKANSVLSGSGLEHQQQHNEVHHHQQQQQQQLEQLSRQGSRAATKSRSRRHSGVDNPAFIVHESQLPFPYSYGVYGSQNEFNASVFGLDASQYVGGAMSPPNMNRKCVRRYNLYQLL